MGTKKPPRSKTKSARTPRSAARGADAASPTCRIFVSYRRDDCGSEVQWFAKHLESVFGPGVVFCDQRTIEPGDLWPDEIRAALDDCTIVLACIGSQWHSLLNHAQSTLRLDDPEDWVRLELMRAHRRGIRVQPILFDGLQSLPEAAIQQRKALRFLNSRQAVPLRATRDLDRDFEAVVAAIVAAGVPKLPVAQQAPPPPADLLARYRDHVRVAHERLVLFGGDGAAPLLASVFVRLDVACEREPDLGAERNGNAPPRDGGQVAVGMHGEASIEEGFGGGFAQMLGEGRSGTLEALVWPEERAVDGRAPQRTGPTRLAVLGEPGAGKSTLARHLAYTLVTKVGETRLPVFVALGRLASGDFDPFRIAAEHALPGSPQAAALAELLRSEAMAGRAVLLLDGLDEVDPTKTSAVDVVRGIAQLAESVPAPIVVMARPVALVDAPLPRSFRRGAVQPLTADERDALAKKLLAAPDAERFVGLLHEHGPFAELCQNPLLLTLAAMVAADAFRRRQPVPTRRGAIYTRAIDVLLQRRHVERGRGVRDPRLVRKLLGPLSLVLHETGGDEWSPDAIDDALWAVRRDEELNRRVKETWAPQGESGASAQVELVRDLEAHAGVLGPFDVQTPNWRYLHRSLCEFLVAERLAELGATAWRPRIKAWAEAVKAARGGEEEQKEHAPWAEVFALLVGCVPESQRLEVLKAIRAVHPPLALRALGNADGLPVADGVAFAMADPEVDGDDLLRWFRAWGVEGAETKRLLMPHVGEGVTVDRLGSIWFVLEELGEPPVREEFFRQAGRPVDPSVVVPWVEIPAGTFVMGSPEGEEGREPSEGPQHEVRVRAFRLARTPVTVAEYRRFDVDHARRSRSRRSMRAPPFETKGFGQEPVGALSWWAAYAYCRWVGGELPSEAQWEYACRAETTTRFWSGDREEDLARVGWYLGTGEWWAHQVGEKPSNLFGLHDMHGNVMEWCADRWHGNYMGAPDNGSAWVEGISGLRVVRGGSWGSMAWVCRSAFRIPGNSRDSFKEVGFRPASSSMGSCTTSSLALRDQTTTDLHKPVLSPLPSPRSPRARRPRP